MKQVGDLQRNSLGNSMMDSPYRENELPMRGLK
jgi:hypothetical protein